MWLYLSIVVCIDIDECILNISMCQPDSYCDNTIGSYLCICNVGYSGDGFINCTSKSTEDVSATIMHGLLQISMSVNLTLMTVMRMHSVMIPLVPFSVPATMDTPETELFAVSLASDQYNIIEIRIHLHNYYMHSLY